MSTPTEQSWKALKRLGRYLCGAPCLVYTYRRQEISAIDVYVDTDWAGCVETRKSTSGGAVMLGKHTIKHWSSTQPSVALSSGEAEFYGVVRGAGQGLGYQSLIKDLGLTLPLRMWTDSSAALGICSRQGLGKLRHLDTHTLWVQQAVRSKRLELKKVLGEENPADLFTKHSISRDRLEKLVKLFDCQFKGGRAESAPQTRTGVSGKKTISQADNRVLSVKPETQEDRPAPGTPAEPDSVGYPEDAGHTDNEINPKMPHNDLSSSDLDQHYPSLEAVEDLDLPDISRLEDDRLYAAGMNVVQDILNEMSQVGRTRRQGTQAEGDRPNAPAPDEDKGRVGGEDCARDRSGFGPGGDRSGNLAVGGSQQVCALNEHECEVDNMASLSSAHPSSAEAHLPFDGISASGELLQCQCRARVLNLIQFPSRRRDSSVVEGDKRNNSRSTIDLSNSCCMPVGGAKRAPGEFFQCRRRARVLSLTQFPSRRRDCPYPTFLETNGSINSDCASTAFSCLRRTRDEDANVTSRDVSICRHELDPTCITNALLGCWSQTVLPSSPRRSVARFNVNFKFCNVGYACSFLFN